MVRLAKITNSSLLQHDDDILAKDIKHELQTILSDFNHAENPITKNMVVKKFSTLFTKIKHQQISKYKPTQVLIQMLNFIQEMKDGDLFLSSLQISAPRSQHVLH